jgi:hypothetical protein
MPSNEEKFIHAATTDDKFRRALRDKDRAYLSRALDDLGISGDKQAILDAIMHVDWRELDSLERRLTGQGVHPEN